VPSARGLLETSSVCNGRGGVVKLRCVGLPILKRARLNYMLTCPRHAFVLIDAEPNVAVHVCLRQHSATVGFPNASFLPAANSRKRPARKQTKSAAATAFDTGACSCTRAIRAVRYFSDAYVRSYEPEHACRDEYGNEYECSWRAEHERNGPHDGISCPYACAIDAESYGVNVFARQWYWWPRFTPAFDDTVISSGKPFPW
jgi:hypothetical protein